jgi:hypothetical protein
MIDIQSLNDALIAVFTTVGVGVAIALAATLAGLLYRRQTARSEHAVPDTIPPQYQTQTDDARELVLR